MTEGRKQSGPDVIKHLSRLLEMATQGPWEIQDSCSWRRIGTRGRDGNVLCPTNSRHDNHPDLTAGHGEDLQANLELIVAAVNALPDLIELAEAVNTMREHMTDHYVSAEDMYVIDSLREALGLFDPEATLSPPIHQEHSEQPK